MAHPLFTVSQITQLLKEQIEESFYSIQIQGEISNFRPASSGHWYFQLSDKNASISAVMFKHKQWNLTFRPRDGQAVIASGSLTVYEKRGTYQIVCETLQEAGKGELLLLLEQRKQLYESKGYFAPERKRELPTDPKRVGVVTSPTGAAVRDIIQVGSRRNNSVNIIILPAAVQGTEAAAQIALQIERANALQLVDVLIVGRGGGSLEDLLAFSDPLVIEAIYHSHIPVVSAVGHETDWALSDFIADMRAPTPSAAAELVFPHKTVRLQTVAKFRQNMISALQNRLSLEQSILERYSQTALTDYLNRRLQNAKMGLDFTRAALLQRFTERFNHYKQHFQLQKEALVHLSPLAILERGYSITTKKTTQEVISAANQVNPHEELTIVLAQGTLEVEVKDHVEI